MQIILWRHAEAEPGTPDLSRRLTAKGVQQAASMAEWLRRYLPQDTTILSSPARRALDTVTPLGLPYRLQKELAPDLDAEQALAAIGWPDAVSSVLLVGHQPMLGRIASLLMTGSASEWEIEKGAVWWLDSPASGTAGGGNLKAVMGPELYSIGKR